MSDLNQYISGLEVVKLEYSLKLKIKRNDWLYFESENELKTPFFLFGFPLFFFIEIPFSSLILGSILI